MSLPGSRCHSDRGENTALNLVQGKGLKPGTYKVIVFLGDDSVDARVFVVKKQRGGWGAAESTEGVSSLAAAV